MAIFQGPDFGPRSPFLGPFPDFGALQLWASWDRWLNFSRPPARPFSIWSWNLEPHCILYILSITFGGKVPLYSRNSHTRFRHLHHTSLFGVLVHDILANLHAESSTIATRHFTIYFTRLTFSGPICTSSVRFVFMYVHTSTFLGSTLQFRPQSGIFAHNLSPSGPFGLISEAAEVK